MVGVLAALALVAAAAAAGGRPNASDLEGQLVCPVCQTTLDQSDAPIALKMKAYIRRRIAAGDSAAQIKAALVAQFGPGVLATPSKSGFGLLAWLVPILVVLGAGLVVGVLVRAWSKRRPPPPPDRPLDPDVERRVDEELARFEG
ncbi:MAG TPA: cytochrome c-type biogenesis protein [Gaiellaceae bacterium]|nr:cytochrome c-type biogenesis protein [Gaiellaceae bacterium]